MVRFTLLGVMSFLLSVGRTGTCFIYYYTKEWNGDKEWNKDSIECSKSHNAWNKPVRGLELEVHHVSSPVVEFDHLHLIFSSSFSSSL